MPSPSAQEGRGGGKGKDTLNRAHVVCPSVMFTGPRHFKPALARLLEATDSVGPVLEGCHGTELMGKEREGKAQMREEERSGMQYGMAGGKNEGEGRE